MAMQNCSCNGTNENCARCWGKGYYDVSELQRSPTVCAPYRGGRLKKSRKRRTLRPPVEMGSGAREPAAPAPTWNGPTVEEERQRARNVRATRPLPKRADRGTPVVVTCPKCPKYYRAADLPKHLRQVHGMRRKASEAEARAAAGITTQEAGSKRRQSGSRSAAPKSGAKQPKKKPPKQRRPGAPLQQPVPPAAQRAAERRLDGSRPYWDGNVRERNIIGSHPTYDGMDDESKP